MPWSLFVSHSDAPPFGNEGGTILLDEEHDLGARITLERKARAAPYAITCGIYGWMVHTRYFSSESDARQAVGDMKRDLQEILEAIPLVNDPEMIDKSRAVMRAVSDFVDRNPT